MFVDFLRDEASFSECERFWARKIGALERAAKQTGKWRRWIPKTYADGKSPIDLRDRPIFDGYRADVERAYRILQSPSTPSTRESVSAWVTTYGSERGPGMPRDELFISLILSPLNVEIALTLLKKWFEPSTTPRDMQDFLSRTTK